MLGVITGAFITRILKAEGKGIMGLLQGDIDLFVLFLGLSLNAAFVYFVSGRKIALEKLAGAGIIVLAAGTAIVSLILVTVSVFFHDSFLFPNGYSSFFYIFYIIAAFFLATFNGLISSIFQGRSLFRVINFVTLFNSIFNILVFGSAFLYNHYYPGTITIKGVFSITLLVLLLNGLLWMYLYLRYIRVKPSFRFIYGTDIKPLLTFAGIGHLSVIINFLNYRLDIWIVEHYRGVTELGYYTQAVALAQMFWYISNPIVNVLSPHLIENQGNSYSQFSFFSKLNSTLVFILIMIALVIADWIIPFVYGQDFENSILPFKLLLPGIFFSCIGKIFSVYIYAQNKVIYNLYATIAGAVVTIALDFILIPAYGIIGASIATTVAYTTIFLTMAYFLFSRINIQRTNYYVLTQRDLRSISQKFLNS